jgi:hypothetical protein
MEGIGFDVISDLHLSPEDSFNWEGKATSLYCIVAGNISSDLRTIHQTLFHLSHFYQGIFYTIGSAEYEGVLDVAIRTEEIIRTCRGIRNVALLMSNVVVIKNVAIMGANCWYGQVKQDDLSDMRQFEDIAYLGHSLEKLQLHMDVSKIIIVTGSVPNPTLFFGEEDECIYDQIPPSICLEKDTERKVSHWVFGSYKKIVDATIDGINYINNPYLSRPYWAKRITV